MFAVYMEIDGTEYRYGMYADRNRANEIAMYVRDTRDCFAWVEEV